MTTHKVFKILFAVIKISKFTALRFTRDADFLMQICDTETKTFLLFYIENTEENLAIFECQISAIFKIFKKTGNLQLPRYK